jgi:phospholipid-binding lipoprotein MlaA
MKNDTTIGAFRQPESASAAIEKLKRVLLNALLVLFLSVFLHAGSVFLHAESAFLYAGELSAAVTNAAAPEVTAEEETSVEDEYLEEEGFEEEAGGIADPLEPWNRLMFGFNDRFYFWLLKPVAQGYGFIVPEQVRIGMRNAFQNIAMPIRFVNCLLQFKVKRAGNELIRFLLNSTLGIGGLFDPAERNLGLKMSEEDTGQTLGFYGFGNGFYIVWPVLGPSSLRDSVGLVGDYFLHPITYIDEEEWRWGLYAFSYLNRASLRIGEYEDFKEAAIDPYVSLRDAYYQYRQNKIKEAPSAPPAYP